MKLGHNTHYFSKSYDRIYYSFESVLCTHQIGYCDIITNVLTFTYEFKLEMSILFMTLRQELTLTLDYPCYYRLGLLYELCKLILCASTAMPSPRGTKFALGQ
jgi:hypothetical protein